MIWNPAGPLTGIHHVRLAVTDLARSRRFWEDIFGYEWEFDFPGADGPAATALRHGRGGPNLVLWLEPRSREPRGQFVSFGIGLPSGEAVEALAAELDSRGIRHGGVQGAFVDVKLPFVEDPDGNLVSFYVKPSPDVVEPA
ncbi:MAG: glyoxalase-like domain protein [Rhodoglobus sp.]|nr:glyoxalase-like domain protein [Rhodoglobus sp.]